MAGSTVIPTCKCLRLWVHRRSLTDGGRWHPVSYRSWMPVLRPKTWDSVREICRVG